MFFIPMSRIRAIIVGYVFITNIPMPRSTYHRLLHRRLDTLAGNQLSRPVYICFLS